MGIGDAVYFLGVRQDVFDLLNVMDIFILTSRFEGFPVTLVEVQANGLPAFVSASVTTEANFSGYLDYLPISKGAKYWSNYVLAKKNIRYHSSNCEYDIRVNAGLLEEKYKKLIQRTK